MREATQSTKPPKPRAYRLRGEPEGVKISAVVKAGARSIGSSPTSDIVVPVFGVSKKHATEAEWEYAARGGDPAHGGTTTEFSFPVPAGWDTGCGSFPAAEPYMWWCGNSGSTTHPVGQKLANPLVLFDMHGNLWEWVGDWYSSTYYGSSPPDDPQGPASGSSRVIRGGNWLGYAHSCRSASRSHSNPGNHLYSISFRLARSQ